MTLPVKAFSIRQLHLDKRKRSSRKCLACIAANRWSLRGSWGDLTNFQNMNKYDKDKDMAKTLKKAKDTFRRRMNVWLDANQGIYLRTSVLQEGITQIGFKDNYEDYILLCYNCGKRDGKITGIEPGGCSHNKIRDTVALADACMAFFSSETVKIICSYLERSNSTVVQIPINAMVGDFKQWNNVPCDPNAVEKTRSFFIQGAPRRRYRAPHSRNKSKKKKENKHFQSSGWD